MYIVRLAARAKSVGLSATIADPECGQLSPQRALGKMRFAAVAQNVLAISGLRAGQELTAICVTISESHVAHARSEVPLW